jgi:hypothetical protein
MSDNPLLMKELPEDARRLQEDRRKRASGAMPSIRARAQSAVNGFVVGIDKLIWALSPDEKEAALLSILDALQKSLEKASAEMALTTVFQTTDTRNEDALKDWLIFRGCLEHLGILIDALVMDDPPSKKK